ncbi:MAG: tetratricopeptide repeat protein, partial [Vulcanimicrobiota bacterium]
GLETYNEPKIQYEENNENERAIETYKRIAEENPGEAEPYRELARLYRLKGDHVESVKAWLSYVFDGLPPEEIVNFLAGMTIAFLIMVYPPVANLVITILLIPFVYLAGVTGNLPGLERLSNIAALFSLDYLIYITNKEIVKLDEKNAVAWSNIGKYYEHRKKFQKAENCYLKALQSDPDMVETVFSLGKVYMVQEKFEQAKLSFKKALTLDSENGTYWYNLGAALYEEGFYSDAANAAKNSLEKSPESISAFSLYIDASEFAGETLECREYLEKVVNKISDDLPALMKMGRFLVEIGQANDALHYFQEAIVLEPDSYEVWYEYGIAQRELGMLEKAANSLDRAADLSQGLPWVLISTGLIRFIKNDLKQSEELLRQALDIDPFSAYGHFLLGRILRKNNSNQATNYLKKSIDFLKNDLEETKKPWEKASNYERMAIAHELTGDKKLARESLDLAVNFAGKTPETLRIFCEERMKLCSPEEFIMECNQKLQMLESEGHVGLEIKKEPS